MQQAEDIFASTTNSIQLSREIGMNNTMRAMDIHAQARDIATQSQQSQDVSY